MRRQCTTPPIQTPRPIIVRYARAAAAACSLSRSLRPAPHRAVPRPPAPASEPQPHETRYYFVAPSPRRSTSVLDVAPLLSQRLRTLMRHHGRFLNQDVERSSSDQFATASANLLSTTPANASPAQAAAQSNLHRPRTAHQPPRVPSSEAFGRRPSPRLYRSTTGRHPKPFTKSGRWYASRSAESQTRMASRSATVPRLTREVPN